MYRRRWPLRRILGFIHLDSETGRFVIRIFHKYVPDFDVGPPVGQANPKVAGTAGDLP